MNNFTNTWNDMIIELENTRNHYIAWTTGTEDFEQDNLTIEERDTMVKQLTSIGVEFITIM